MVRARKPKPVPKYTVLAEGYPFDTHDYGEGLYYREKPNGPPFVANWPSDVIGKKIRLVVEVIE